MYAQAKTLTHELNCILVLDYKLTFLNITLTIQEL
jgi:hypothetical protein